MDKSSFLADIGTIVTRLKNVDVAYIFGSFLEGEEFNDRYNFAPVRKLGSIQKPQFSLKVAGELERQIIPRFEFDVKILNNAPVESQFEVIEKGCIIFSRDETRRIEYEFEVISTDLDLKYMYDYLDKEFLARA